MLDVGERRGLVEELACGVEFSGQQPARGQVEQGLGQRLGHPLRAGGLDGRVV